MTIIHNWEDIFRVGESVKVGSLSDVSVMIYVVDPDEFGGPVYKDDQLCEVAFKIITLNPTVVLEWDNFQYHLEGTGFTLNRLGAKETYELGKFEEASLDSAYDDEGGGVDWPLELKGSSTQRENEKVIPTQRGATNNPPSSTEGFREAHKENEVKDEMIDGIEPVCPIALRVAQEIMQRASVGLNKYGVNADRNDLSLLEWLTHAQTEAIALAIYLAKIKKELGG